MLWAISFFNYADRQAIFSVFPLLQSSMHLSNVQLGLLGSAFAWVYGLGGMFAGALVDRMRRKTAILGGLYVWSIICAATAAVTGFRGLFAMRALEGLGETFYFPASMSLVSDYHGKETRSRAIGIHQTSVYAGTIAGGFFAGLIGQVYGWRWSFVVFGGLGILLGFVLNRWLIEPVRGAADNDVVRQVPLRESLRQIWSSKPALLLMGAFCCANFVAVVLLTWMPKFLFDRFHMSLAMSGLSATIYVQAASMCGSLLGGWLADKWRARTPGGRMLVQAIGVFGGAPCVALCGMTQSLGWLIVALTVWGLFKGLYDANIFASMFDTVGTETRGTAAGFMNTFGWLAGGGSAPLVIGWISESQGLGPAIAMASSVYLLAGVLLLLAARGAAIGQSAVAATSMPARP
ncbi:MAG: major facilitator superfamily 1 [Bryobacterales bacterium]|nr:major facilitator superfamily 1 [Bryobacterales bacterium]